MNSKIHLQSEAALAVPKVPPSSMGAVWRTIRGYVLWQYERGTLHYDIMVTLILLFIFLSPRYINFKDKPVARNPQAVGVMVIPDSQGGFIYQIPATAVNAGSDADIRHQLERIIEPIAGAVSVTKYEPVKDPKGHTQNYKVWINKE
ncbi:MAG TPA: hypothetical protein VMT67_07345 [Terriglobales bacterium]|nr:hypothetical protein [Terriglobales bacterium]